VCYMIFVYAKNDLINTQIKGLSDTSKLLPFKKIFSEPDNKNPLSDGITGLYSIVRNVFAHGTFLFENGPRTGEIILEERKKKISVTVSTYYLLEFCMQIERLYKCISSYPAI